MPMSDAMSGGAVAALAALEKVAAVGTLSELVSTSDGIEVRKLLARSLQKPVEHFDPKETVAAIAEKAKVAVVETLSEFASTLDGRTTIMQLAYTPASYEQDLVVVENFKIVSVTRGRMLHPKSVDAEGGSVALLVSLAGLDSSPDLRDAATRTLAALAAVGDELIEVVSEVGGGDELLSQLCLATADLCPVCCEPLDRSIAEGPCCVVTLPCHSDHCGHHECIGKWAERRVSSDCMPTCLVCRAPFTSVRDASTGEEILMASEDLRVPVDDDHDAAANEFYESIALRLPNGELDTRPINERRAEALHLRLRDARRNASNGDDDDGGSGSDGSSGSAARNEGATVRA